MAVEETYNDNIFLVNGAEEKETDDFITKVIPSASVTYERPRINLTLDYSFEEKVYSENEGQNNERHSAEGALSLTMVRKLLFVEVTDSFSVVPLDTNNSTVEEEVDVNLVEKNIFSVTPYLERDITAKTTFRGGYTFTNVEYEGSQAEDIHYNIAFASLEGRVTPKLVITAGGEAKEKDGDGLTEDYEVYKGYGTIFYQVTPAISLDATVGNNWFDYEIAGNVDYLYWDAIASANIVNKSTLSANYSRAPIESPLSGIYRSDLVAVKFKYGNRLVIHGEGSVREDDYIDSTRIDRFNSGKGGVSWEATKNMGLSVEGSYTEGKFSDNDEETELTSMKAEVSYALHKWLSVEARYRYTDKDSTISTNSFTNNAYTIQLKSTYR